MWLHGCKVDHEPNSLLTAANGEAMNPAITHEFELFHRSPIPKLAQWFQRTAAEVHTESLQFKSQWLSLVRDSRSALTNDNESLGDHPSQDS